MRAPPKPLSLLCVGRQCFAIVRGAQGGMQRNTPFSDHVVQRRRGVELPRKLKVQVHNALDSAEWFGGEGRGAVNLAVRMCATSQF